MLNGLSQSVGIDNRPASQRAGVPCSLWSLDWFAEPTVTGLQIEIQAAPDDDGVPGSFATAVSGTALPSGKALLATGYYPWVRVALTVLQGSGSVCAVLTGWRDDPASIATQTATVQLVPETSDDVSSAGPVTLGTSSTQLLAANPDRKRLILQNVGTTKIFVLFGSGTASSSNYHVALPAGGTSNDGSSPLYVDELWTGAIQAISSAVGGAIQALEFT